MGDTADLYYLQGGPSVDRFRGLATDIATCRDSLTRRFEAGPSLLKEPFRSAASSATLTIELNLLFSQLMRLKIPLPDYNLFNESGQTGKEFWVAYLTALEELAQRGYLSRARSKTLVGVIWRTVGIEPKETGGESNV